MRPTAPDPDKMATDVIGIMRHYSFHEFETHLGNGSEEAIKAIANVIAYGADLVRLSNLGEDKIYGKRSLLHVLCRMPLFMIGSAQYADVEAAVARMTAPNPATGSSYFDPDQLDDIEGKSPMHYAIDYASPNVIMLLLQAGANLELPAREWPHRTPRELVPHRQRPDVQQVIDAWDARKAIESIIRKPPSAPA